MYTNFELTRASFKVGDGDWIPLKNVQSIEMDFDEGPPVDTGWVTDGNRMYRTEFTLECKIRRVPLLRFFAYKPSMARRKIWRYMEHCGL